MDTLKINTPQNIEIEQPIASVGERIAATMIDFLVISAYSVVLVVIYANVKSAAVWIASSLPVFFYSLLCEMMMNGQTFGKKVFKTRVIKTDGTPVSFSNYFMRWIIGLFEIYACSGLLALLVTIVNGKGQRLGDMAAGTALIRIKNRSLNQNIYTELPDNYTVVFPEAGKLSINDIYTIEEVLQLLRSGENPKQTLQIAQKAREALLRKMNVGSGLDVTGFFETIIRDFNYIHSRG